MKKSILLLALIVISFSVLGQEGKQDLYKAVVIHYNSKWQVTKPEAAVMKRLAYLPTTINSIKNLHAPSFRYAVTDYFADNTVLARGHYDEYGKKWSKWVFYHQNGQVDCEGAFVDNKPSGVWKFWRPDGQPLMEINYIEEGIRLINSWNDKGEQTLKDGNGVYSISVPATDGAGRNILQGPCVNGYQSGTWQIINSSGQVELEQNYGEKGEFISGKFYKEGNLTNKYAAGDKRILGQVYGSSDRITLQGVPDYMGMMEEWNRDRAYYQATYPVAAELLEGEVERVDLKAKKGESSYYYRIIQKFESGQIDTIMHGAPLVMPVFKRGDSDFYRYFATNTKFPKELKSAQLEGLLTIEFTVSAAGKVKNAKVHKSLSPLVDEEALRVVSSMPNWKPGTKLGKPVDVSMIIPFRFHKGGYKISKN